MQRRAQVGSFFNISDFRRLMIGVSIRIRVSGLFRLLSPSRTPRKIRPQRDTPRIFGYRPTYIAPRADHLGPAHRDRQILALRNGNVNAGNIAGFEVGFGYLDLAICPTTANFGEMLDRDVEAFFDAVKIGDIVKGLSLSLFCPLAVGNVQKAVLSVSARAIARRHATPFRRKQGKATIVVPIIHILIFTKPFAPFTPMREPF